MGYFNDGVDEEDNDEAAEVGETENSRINKERKSLGQRRSRRRNMYRSRSALQHLTNICNCIFLLVAAAVVVLLSTLHRP